MSSGGTRNPPDWALLVCAVIALIAAYLLRATHVGYDIAGHQPRYWISLIIGGGAVAWIFVRFACRILR